jgi:hypothetical protein
VPWLDRHTSFGCRVARPPNDERNLLQERASHFGAVLFHAPKKVPPSRCAYPRLWQFNVVKSTSVEAATDLAPLMEAAAML